MVRTRRYTETFDLVIPKPNQFIFVPLFPLFRAVKRSDRNDVAL